MKTLCDNIYFSEVTLGFRSSEVAVSEGNDFVELVVGVLDGYLEVIVDMVFATAEETAQGITH